MFSFEKVRHNIVCSNVDVDVDVREVACMSFSSEGDYCAVGHASGAISLWNVASVPTRVEGWPSLCNSTQDTTVSAAASFGGLVLSGIDADLRKFIFRIQEFSSSRVFSLLHL